MTKRKRYNDEERAGAVLMLQAAGYPEQKGAMARVARHTNITTRTLRRWWLGTSNPIPDNIVARNKKTILDKLDTVAHMILDSVDLETVDEAELRERMVALGIVLDKNQLLSGGPTQNVNQQILMKWAE